MNPYKFLFLFCGCWIGGALLLSWVLGLAFKFMEKDDNDLFES